jgi:hypothetical protein
MGGKIVDHDDRFSASMGSFAPEKNAAHFPDRFVRTWRSSAYAFSDRNVQIF